MARRSAPHSTVISYVRGPHDAEVFALAHRLISEGVPCALDLFEPRPAGGWSRWMAEKMTGTDVVLVVCSEPYYRRYHLEEKPGVGQGATFESGMLSRRVLEAQGLEHGVIPIVFDPQDVKWIPEFLKDETRFVLPPDYDDLYRVLTDQLAYVKPPLGAVRPMPSVSPSSATASPASSNSSSVPRLAFFDLGDDGGIVAPLVDFSREGKALKVVLAPRSTDEASALGVLQHSRKQIGIAYNLTAMRAAVRGFREYLKDGQDLVAVDVIEDEPSGYPMEMSYNGVSADEIAVLRARRVLLDEKLTSRSGPGGLVDKLNDMTFDSFVSGRIGSSIAVTGSPIPPLVRSAAVLDDEILVIARLTCVLLLQASQTVERISRLDLEAVKGGVSVEFTGVRKRQYQNVAPTIVNVSGICPTSA